MAARELSRAIWNMRLLGLFLVGPAMGLALVSVTFGLSAGLLRLAAAMACLSLGLLGWLVRAEYVRLARLRRP